MNKFLTRGCENVNSVSCMVNERGVLFSPWDLSKQCTSDTEVYLGNFVLFYDKKTICNITMWSDDFGHILITGKTCKHWKLHVCIGKARCWPIISSIFNKTCFNKIHILNIAKELPHRPTLIRLSSESDDLPYWTYKLFPNYIMYVRLNYCVTMVTYSLLTILD